MPDRPRSLNLANWRQPPHGRWAFHHVREILPSESISRGDAASPLASAPSAALDDLRTPGPAGDEITLADWLGLSNSDALLVAHRGRLVHEWYVEPAIETHPHIVFSISKSITGTLAGVLVAQGSFDPARMVVDYIPELAESGYRDARVQHVLDMAVRIEFTEDYVATSGPYIDYRTATAWHPCPVDAIDQNTHDFLASLARADGDHGEVWQYKSPNSDLLGWLLERASGARAAELLTRHLWQPLGAEADAYITVDRKGAARTAGGLCVVPRDLLRFAEMVRNDGAVDGRQVIPAAWIDDCRSGGSHDAWRRGESVKEFPRGRYRNKWYNSGDDHATMLAIGIHGQWIYIDPVAEVTIVKLSAQDEPLRADLDNVNLRAFANIAAAYGG